MMTREERARQFAPFDALKGLQEALRDREERHSRVERHDISDEQIEINSQVLLNLERGNVVQMDCYRAFHDISMKGKVQSVDRNYRFLRLTSGERIPFEDIYTIAVID